MESHPNIKDPAIAKQAERVADEMQLLMRQQELVEAQLKLQRTTMALSDPKLMSLPDPASESLIKNALTPIGKAYVLTAIECGFGLIEIAAKLGTSISTIYNNIEADDKFKKLFHRSRKLQVETLKDFALQNIKSMDADNYKFISAQAAALGNLIESLDLEFAQAKGKAIEIVFKPFVAGVAR